MTWDEILRQKVRAVHGEIAALQAYVAGEEGLAPAEAAARLDALAAGHYAMLDDLYLRQIPFARAAAGTDFFLNYRGPSGPGERAGIGAVDRLFGTVRSQTAAMTDAVLAARDEAAAAPRGGPGEAELTVRVCAPGLYVGFALPEGNGAPALALEEGLRHLGAAARALGESDPAATLAGEIDDPQVRDAALGALRRLFPHRDRTVEAVELRGRALGLPEGAPVPLDQAAWQAARRLMARPMAETERKGDLERAAFTGHLLQIDYELQRFELRGIEGAGIASLRCAYPEALAAACEGMARKRVEVRGAVALRRGRPRLLQVEEIREV